MVFLISMWTYDKNQLYRRKNIFSDALARKEAANHRQVLRVSETKDKIKMNSLIGYKQHMYFGKKETTRADSAKKQRRHQHTY